MSSNENLVDLDEAEEAAAADMTVEEWRACTGPATLTLDEIAALQDEYDI